MRSQPANFSRVNIIVHWKIVAPPSMFILFFTFRHVANKNSLEKESTQLTEQGFRESIAASLSMNIRQSYLRVVVLLKAPISIGHYYQIPASSQERDLDFGTSLDVAFPVAAGVVPQRLGSGMATIDGSLN